MTDIKDFVDLHLHTVASDGTFTPGQLVDQACQKGLRAIAVTDHDSWESIAAVSSLGAKVGLEVLPGIELSTMVNDTEIHILGYFIDYNDRMFQAQVLEFKSARLERAQRMVEKLARLGVQVELQRVLEIAKTGAVGRPHVAKALLEQGYVGSVDEAFARYIGSEGPAYVPKEILKPEESFKLIHAVGGLCFFAHPGIENRDELIDDFVPLGLDGIEVWHSKHNPSQVKHYLALAARHNLLVSGGSDYHGENWTDVSKNYPRVPYEVVDKMKQRLKARTIRKWTTPISD